MQGVKHIILVLSGKGGVGKSTVSAQLASCFLRKGFKVGILDVDLCGPSIPQLVGLQNQSVKKSSQGWIPVYADEQKRLAVMSIGFLIPDPTSAVIWRGPKKDSMIKQFIEDVVWGDIDYLIVDTPPGTSDEHLSTIESLRQYKTDGVVMVTTPQNLAVADVRREIAFCQKTGLTILGLIENMSGFVCPHCADCTNIFSSEGGRLLAENLNIPFIGKIPLDPRLTECCENGQSFEQKFPESTSLQALTNFVNHLVASHSSSK